MCYYPRDNNVQVLTRAFVRWVCQLIDMLQLAASSSSSTWCLKLPQFKTSAGILAALVVIVLYIVAMKAYASTASDAAIATVTGHFVFFVYWIVHYTDIWRITFSLERTKILHFAHAAFGAGFGAMSVGMTNSNAYAGNALNVLAPISLAASVASLLGYCCFACRGNGNSIGNSIGNTGGNTAANSV
jgi:hypothetical protein